MTDQVVAAIATALAGVVLIPQTVRLIRRREVAGVAVTWAALGFVGNLAWAFYLVATDVWLAAIAPGVAVLSYAAIVRLVAHSFDRRWVLIAASYGLALVAIGHFGSLTLLGITLVVVPAVQVAPQVAAVYREAQLPGVSPSTWALSVAAAGLWMIYGMLVDHVALIGYGMVRGVASGLVLLGWWMSVRWQPLPRRLDSVDRLQPAGRS